MFRTGSARCGPGGPGVCASHPAAEAPVSVGECRPGPNLLAPRAVRCPVPAGRAGTGGARSPANPGVPPPLAGSGRRAGSA